ncbi:MAG: ATP-binding cassette domain-containing protein, partial [Actinomycetota bacterium]
MSLSVDIRARRNGFVLETAFTADPGETVAILGPNGAGKSTLVAVIAGLLRPEAGRVVFEGMGPAGGLPPIGVVFQGLLLLPHLSVLENVAFPLRARGVAAQEARRRARDELARVEA